MLGIFPLILVATSTAPAAIPKDVPAIHWQFGPRTLTLSGLAAVSVPKGMVSAGKAETKRFLEAAGNPIAGDELGILAPASLDWFLLFTFDPFAKLGVQHAQPTVPEIVAALKRGSNEANAARRKAGRETLDLQGWRERPFYNDKTHRLEWSVDTQESGGRHDANRFWLWLTRGGVLTVELVTEEPRFAVASQNAEALVDQLGIVEQEEYSDPDSHDWITIALGVLAVLLPAFGFSVLYILANRKKKRPVEKEPDGIDG
jgi:uncharacterized membrane-anchored protein